MRFGTFDANEAILCTHVGTCAGMNVGNIKIHQWIITTNTGIVERYIQFDGDNTYDPICLNCVLDNQKNILKRDANFTGYLHKILQG